MILIIDNYDSFTYNLVQAVEAAGYKCEVYLNDKITISEIISKRPKKIIISPGPGRPKDAGISNDVIKHLNKTIPILGVCLGHQCIGVNFGAKLVHAKNIMHGKTSTIKYQSSKLFEDLPSSFEAARYHSLSIEDVKQPIIVTATAEDGTIMAIEHKNYPLYGIQFHPESFLTDHGDKIIRNFLK